MTTTPQLDKLHVAMHEAGHEIETFLQWFRDHNLVICESREGALVPTEQRSEQILARYFDIDLVAAEKERLAILADPKSSETDRLSAKLDARFIRAALGNYASETAPFTAFAIVTRGDLVLTISRKDDLNDLNLPGGKCEPGETGAAAACRELLEEAGLVAVATTFVCWRREGENDRVEVYLVGIEPSAEPVAREAGRVVWVKPEEACKGTYGEFNRLALHDAGLLPDPAPVVPVLADTDVRLYDLRESTGTKRTRVWVKGEFDVCDRASCRYVGGSYGTVSKKTLQKYKLLKRNAELMDMYKP